MRTCSHPGCPEIVTSGYCLKHKTDDKKASGEYRNPAWQRLYSSKKWQITRKNQLIKHPWCEECLRANPPIYTPATDVDHIEPHRGDKNLFYYGKLQSLCHSCHSKKTAQEVFGRGG
jgi:5-methylcytosine-specific restriction protein A